MKQLHGIIKEIGDQSVVLIGSSLGGFYATCISERYGLPAALVNPATGPFERWHEYIGEHKNFYSDTLITVTSEHVGELESLDILNLAT